MNFFVNLSVKKKIVSVFSVVCIFIILIGVEGIISSDKINDGSMSIYSNNLQAIKNLEETKGNVNSIRAEMLRIVFERDKSKLDEETNNINDLTNEDVIYEKDYLSTPFTSTEEEKAYGDYKSDLIKYREGRVTVINLAKANNYLEATNLNIKLDIIRISMSNNLGKCIEINVKSAEKANLDNIAQFRDRKSVV